jgi:pilus assembly protein CpaC
MLVIGIVLLSAGLSPIMSMAVEEPEAEVMALPPEEPAMAPSVATLPVTASQRDEHAGTVQVPLYKSAVVRLEQNAKRISVGNPGIADLISLRGNQMYILGKALGNTNITAWNADEKIIATYDVEVTHDLETLKKKIHELLPDEKIWASSAQERIVLSGEASSLAKMSAARDLAQSFLPECIDPQTDIEVTDAKTGTRSAAAPGRGRSAGQKCKEGGIVNLMQVGGAQQVMLEVKVAEMSRTLARRLDTNFNVLRFGNGGRSQAGLISGGATFPNGLTADGLEVPVFGALNGGSTIIGPVADVFQPNTPAIQNTGLFLGHLSGKYAVEAVIDASRNKGLAKILAEPTLTTLTGEEAEFLAGGEFPIPVPQSGGATGSITVTFKEFGVGVKFLPVVLDSGRINMKMSVSVSELSNAASVVLGVSGTASTFLIPSLTKRSSAATVELADGQTIGIAGLLNDNLRENVEKFPGLGDLPLLGALFRSQEYQSGQTELVIFVTAHLAKPISPSQVRLPTESFVPPSDLEFYLMGKLEARKAPEAPARRTLASPRGGTDRAQFGHQP